MDWKKLGKALLYPHKAVIGTLTPIAVTLLILSAVLWDTGSVTSILSYVISAYTLTIWCFRIPRIITWFQSFKTDNKYARRWQEDTRLRVNVSLFGSLAWNTLYGVFQLWLGIYHHTFWFSSLGTYYICLAVMRFFLVRYTVKNKPGEKMREELIRYRLCGWLFLAMNLALSLMVFFMVYWNRTFIHHEITTIAMAAYTFTALTVAIISTVRYRKYNSPVYSASKAISLAAACVSMLTLESTMLTTFDDGTMDLLTRRILLGTSGGAISVFIIAMAIYMIARSYKKLKLLKTAKE